MKFQVIIFLLTTKGNKRMKITWNDAEKSTFEGICRLSKKYIPIEYFGEGTMYDSEETKMVGAFENGKLVDGIATFKDGSQFKGKYKLQGEMNGEMTYADGQKSSMVINYPKIIKYEGPLYSKKFYCQHFKYNSYKMNEAPYFPIYYKDDPRVFVIGKVKINLNLSIFLYEGIKTNRIGEVTQTNKLNDKGDLKVRQSTSNGDRLIGIWAQNKSYLSEKVIHAQYGSKIYGRPSKYNGRIRKLFLGYQRNEKNKDQFRYQEGELIQGGALIDCIDGNMRFYGKVAFNKGEIDKQKNIGMRLTKDNILLLNDS